MYTHIDTRIDTIMANDVNVSIDTTQRIIVRLSKREGEWKKEGAGHLSCHSLSLFPAPFSDSTSHLMSYFLGSISAQKIWYMHIYIYMCMYIYIICTYIHIYTYICVYIYIHIYMHRGRSSIHIHIYVNMHIDVYTYEYI